jgi:AcrR family transcriptional regulator
MDHSLQKPQSSTPALDARMVRSRAALRAALLELLEQKPFDQITIREITSTAGTGYATFFRHYETKSALLNDLAADQISALLQMCLPVLRVSDARPAAIALCRHVDKHRKLWTALLTGGAAGTMREEFIRQASRVPPFMRPQPHTWLPDDLRIIFGVCATVEILAWWLQKGRSFTVEQVAEIIDRMVITPAVRTD